MDLRTAAALGFVSHEARSCKIGYDKDGGENYTNDESKPRRNIQSLNELGEGRLFESVLVSFYKVRCARCNCASMAALLTRKDTTVQSIAAARVPQDK